MRISALHLVATEPQCLSVRLPFVYEGIQQIEGSFTVPERVYADSGRDH